MIRKFFPLDKNYLLEQAQFRSKHHLLSKLYQMAADVWMSRQNPLGLHDEFSRKILDFAPEEFSGLSGFYEIVAAVYRLRHGSNQLELLWDGTDPMDQYALEWQKIFILWITEYCKHPIFVQAVLDLSVFRPLKGYSGMTDVRMKRFVLSRFELQYKPSKGLIPAIA